MKSPFILAIVLLLAFTSCKKEPIKLDSEVTVTNTLQIAADPSMGGTGGVETPVEVVFGVPTGTFVLNAKIGDGIEFDQYLNGLYDIDISEESISFELVADANDPVYSNFFRTIEAGTFDRYYFKFNEDQKIGSGKSNNSSVSLQVISDSEVMVQIGEGFNFNPGSKFSIALEK